MTGVHALHSDEILSVLLVFVLVSENDFGKRCATAWIVHDILHQSLDVSKHRIRFYLSFESLARHSMGRRSGRNARFLHHEAITYPFLSAKSNVLKRAGETLFEVWALKIVLAPRLCTIQRNKGETRHDKNLSENGLAASMCYLLLMTLPMMQIQFLKIIKFDLERDTFFAKILNKHNCIIIN